MKLEGIHHITAITADAQDNVDFFAGVLGLRLVKKTVNQDQPTVYHLFFADEQGNAGSDLTFFEFPGVPDGRAGAGNVHRIVWRVRAARPTRWTSGPSGSAHTASRASARGRACAFPTPEGLDHELLVVYRSGCAADRRPPRGARRAGAAGLPRGARLRRLGRGRRPVARGAPVRAHRGRVGRRGARKRGGLYIYDEPPAERPLQGAGSVHHVAWASWLKQHEDWREKAIGGGAQPTPVIDRFYFRSIYFREPSGVLFEIATLGPGFTVDEELEHLGEKLSLPPDYEHLRAEVEANLRPVVNPRSR